MGNLFDHTHGDSIAGRIVIELTVAKIGCFYPGMVIIRKGIRLSRNAHHILVYFSIAIYILVDSQGIYSELHISVRR